MPFEPSILLGPLALGILLLLVLSGFLAVSIALVYHWRAYGMNTGIIRTAPAAYFSVAGVFIVIAAVSYLVLL